jgi:hypothetical protein
LSIAAAPAPRRVLVSDSLVNAALWGETFEVAPDGMKCRDRLVEWAKGLVNGRIEFATFLCVLGRLPHPMASADRRSVAEYLGIPVGWPARLVREFYESCLRLKESKKAALPGDASGPSRRSAIRRTSAWLHSPPLAPRASWRP